MEHLRPLLVEETGRILGVLAREPAVGRPDDASRSGNPDDHVERPSGGGWRLKIVRLRRSGERGDERPAGPAGISAQSPRLARQDYFLWPASSVSGQHAGL
jgi:hypothetical protein